MSEINFATDGAILPCGLFIETGNHIASVQLESGAIPWFKGHLVDPWDHVEAAMGLAITGHHGRARRALEWFAERQAEDGGLWPAYDNNTPLDKTRQESHHQAYLASGLWHYYLITGDLEFLARLWPHVEAALDRVLAMQSPHGEIAWATDRNGAICPDALVTGCSSIFKSIENALCIAQVFGLDRPLWEAAQESLGEALRNRPDRFDRTWESKVRYAMDWFYPVLCGVFREHAARNRLKLRWDTFVHPGRGCRCVSDEPWITVAESCELVMALVATGQKQKAARVFSWLHSNRTDNGAYWTGYQTDLNIFWPQEQTTWTAGALLMAADALYQITPAAHFFTTASWPDIKYKIDIR